MQAHISRSQPGYCESQGAINLAASPSGGLFIGSGITGNQFNTQEAGAGEHLIVYLYADSFNCSSSDTINLLVYKNPDVSIYGLNNEYCANGNPAYMSGFPAGGQFFGDGVIINVFDPKIAGANDQIPVSYSYTDLRGCTGSDTVWVTVNPLPELILENSKINYCLNASPFEPGIQPTGGIFIGSGISNNQFDPVLAGTGAHNIIYYYTDSNRCSNSIVARIIVEVCSGISEIENSNWLIYPNPFDNRIELQTTARHHVNMQMKLMNILGQSVYQEQSQLHPGVNTLSLEKLENLPPGIYHLEILTGDKLTVKKLVKSR